MAYTVNQTSGAILTTISDGTIDTTTDLILIGKNYAGYGEFLNENFVKILENFANTSAPSSPLTGQMWWDTTNGLLKVYNGTTFKTVSSSTASASTPTSPVTGDLWWDTTNGQLKVYDGTSFVTIGPAFTSGTGVSGSIVEIVRDNAATDHVVVKLFVSSTIVGIVSKDTEFTPQTAISGFATIKPGFQLSTAVSGAKLQGTATDSDALGGIVAENYLRSNTNDSTSGVLTIANDTGLVIGVDSDLTVGVSGNNVIVANTTLDGDIVFRVNDNSVITTALTIEGATSRLVVAGVPTAANGVATKGYVDTTALLRAGGTMTGDILSNDGNQDIGSSGTPFQAVYATTFSGTATSAQYADVAENFAADAQYAPGTVVALGGVREITAAVEDSSDSVFGVISNKPAYLMNAALTDGLPVAVTGRVPVRVIGMVNKGDRLVSAGNGLARAAKPGEATSFNVIGRAIEPKNTQEEGPVEAFVTIN